MRGTGRRGRRPLTRGAAGKTNPPVTASPCQPPLGKGAEKAGVRIATTSLRTGLAMTPLTRGAVQTRAGGQRRPPLRRGCKGCVGEGLCPSRRAGKSAKRRRWRMQRAGFEEVPRLADTTVAGNRLARRWAREPRPYEFFAIQFFAIKKGCR